MLKLILNIAAVLLLMSPSLADVSSSSALVVFSENRDRILEGPETEQGQFVFFCFSGDAMYTDQGDGMLAVEELISKYVLRHQEQSLNATAAIQQGRLESLASEFGLGGNKIAYQNLPRWVVFNHEDEGDYYYVVALRKSDLLNLELTKDPITLGALTDKLQQRLQQSTDKSLVYYSINAFDCAISIHNDLLNQNSSLANYVVRSKYTFSMEWYDELETQLIELRGQRLELPAAEKLLNDFPALPQVFACLGRELLVDYDFTGYINCMMLAGPGAKGVLRSELEGTIKKTSNAGLKEYPIRLENAATKTYPPIVSFVRQQQGFVNFSGDWDRSASQSHYRRANKKFNKGQPIDTIQHELFEALKSDPTHAEAWNLLGVLLKNNDDMQGALACFRQSLRLDPKAPNPMANLALIYEAQSKHELATGMAIAACLHAAPGEWAYRKAEELLSKN